MSTAVKRAPKARVAAQKPDLAPLARTLKIGERAGGGILAARFFLDDTPYGLIVSPRKEGEIEGTWLDEYKDVPKAVSLFDGVENTIAMADAGSELAKKIINLRIGGYEDWYLMSKGEGLLAYAADLTGPEAFPKKWHWTSTQHPGNRYCAWLQNFSDGIQDYGSKDNRYAGRAVRRWPIQWS